MPNITSTGSVRSSLKSTAAPLVVLPSSSLYTTLLLTRVRINTFGLRLTDRSEIVSV